MGDVIVSLYHDLEKELKGGTVNHSLGASDTDDGSGSGSGSGSVISLTDSDGDSGSTNSCADRKQNECFKQIHDLGLYEPNDILKEALKEKFSKDSLMTLNNVMKTYMQTPQLTENNVDVVLKTLLQIEDVHCMAEYPPLIQKDIILNSTTKQQEFWITLNTTVPNIDDIVVPFIDEVVVVPKLSSATSVLKYEIDVLMSHEHERLVDKSLQRRIATVIRVTKNELHFRFNAIEDWRQSKLHAMLRTKFDLIIRSTRLPLRYQYRALELLADEPRIRQYLFPKVKLYENKSIVPSLKGLKLINETISSNPEQLSAVQNIVQGPSSHAPYIIFGPPGTGKTTTVVEAILQLRLNNPLSRILVTAASNSACDTIALRICKYLNSNHYAAHHHQPNAEQKFILRIYSKSIIQKDIEQIPDALLSISNCPKYNHYYPSVNKIREYSIVVVTLCTVGKLVTGDLGVDSFFTHIFIDEAGACSEPETLIGIMGLKSERCSVILSGDHKQLGPVLRSDRVIQLGMAKSLMERLHDRECYAVDAQGNYDRSVQCRLIRNYRSHPQIVKLFNHLYYNDELIAKAKLEDVNMAAEWCKLPNSDFPIIFQAVHGKTEKSANSPSSYNNLELEVIMWFLRRLLNDGINGKKVKQSDIGIITPYKQQCFYINERIKRCKWSDVEVGTVEKFQGREKHIIIVSLVKSFACLGFVKHPQRLNVILSRPQSLLIIIGNPLTLRRTADFKYIIEECCKQGTLLRKPKSRSPSSRSRLDQMIARFSEFELVLIDDEN